MNICSTLRHPNAWRLINKTVERLLRFGRFISLATQPSEFPDRKVAEIVAATQSCLKDKLALWHGPKQSEERREQILKACFNEP